MNLKDAISFFKNRKKNNCNLEELVGQYNEDCPVVKIKNVELTVSLGQWMGALPDAVKTGGNGTFVITQIDSNELLKRKRISEKELSNVVQRFSNILRMAGFGKGNTCILDRFEPDDLSFRCTFENTGETSEMRVRFGSWLDDGPALFIDYDNIHSVYEFWHEDKHQPDRLYLQSLTKDLDLDGNKKFYHYVSEFRYIASIYNKEKRLDVEIQYPESLEYGFTENPYIDREKIEEFISSITLSEDIESIVSRIPEALTLDAKEYPTIAVVIKKLGNDRLKDIVTDEATFKDGEFTKLTITRKGKKVTLDNFDTWSYTTDIGFVDQTSTPDQSKTISYGYKAIPVDKLEHIDSPQVLVSEAKEYVEEVKKLGKVMLQKRTH
jgi:hypothetical protein